MLRPIPIAIGAGVVLIVLVALALMAPGRRRRIAPWVAAAWIAVILGVTLIGGSDGTGEENLVPGRTIYEQLTNFDHAGGVFNVLGNVGLFIPLGWLLALIARRRVLLTATIVGVSLSAVVEIVQSMIGRVADIDDVILNGAGALLGAGAALLLMRATSARTLPPAPTAPQRQ